MWLANPRHPQKGQSLGARAESDSPASFFWVFQRMTLTSFPTTSSFVRPSSIHLGIFRIFLFRKLPVQAKPSFQVKRQSITVTLRTTCTLLATFVYHP